MTRRLFGCVLLAAALAIAVSLPLSVAADSTATPYRQAVADALAIVENAQPGDVAVARHAAQVLIDGTGNTQPEVLSDLRESPPDFKTRPPGCGPRWTRSTTRPQLRTPRSRSRACSR